MDIIVKRVFNCPDYCISHIYIDGVYVCDGIEDTDRMLDSSMSGHEIYNKKVPGRTAIPVGTYVMTLDVRSPKYSKSPYFQKICKGKLPRLLDVIGFDGILWHTGNSASDSAGCLILGYNKVKGKVLNSRVAFEKVYGILSGAKDKILVHYKRTY